MRIAGNFRKLKDIVFAFFIFIFFASTILGPVHAQVGIGPTGVGTQFVNPAAVVGAQEVSRIEEVNSLNTSNKEAEAGHLSSPNYFDTGVKTTAASFLCLLHPEPCAQNPAYPTQNAMGPYSSLVGYIGDMYKYKPANTDRYVADLMQDMHIGVSGAKPVYAQGLGFASLDPILSVWKIFRNIAYMCFIIVFLLIGFLIMFRQKIGSQAVVTAQQAIPNIIVALLAVTFSYAIAGLLIDAMYLIMFFIATMFNKTELINMNFAQLTTYLIGSGTASSGADKVGSFVADSLGPGVLTEVARFLSNITAAIIIWLVIVFNAFKLFFNLLRVYVDIILNIAFAPIILMAGAIPGQNTFGPWLKNLIANLAVFPGILVLIIIFTVLQKSAGGGDTGGAFSPPYMGGTGLGASYLPFLAGLALILALPQAVEEIKKALGAQQGGLFGALIQAGLKNAGTTADLGVPISMGAGGGLYGGVLAGRRAFQDPNNRDTTGRRQWRKIASQTYGGALNDEGKATIGGALPRAAQFFNLGRQVRKQAHMAGSADFLDPNTVQDVLRQELKRTRENLPPPQTPPATPGGSTKE